MNTTKTNDVAELTKLSLMTFNNIGQMARYRVDYLMRNQNRDKMITHACLACFGIFGLLAIGIAGLTNRE